MKITGRTLNEGIWEEIRIYINPLRDFTRVKLIRKSIRGDRLSIDILNRDELLKLLKKGSEVLERLRREEENSSKSCLLRFENFVESLYNEEDGILNTRFSHTFNLVFF